MGLLLKFLVIDPRRRYKKRKYDADAHLCSHMHAQSFKRALT